MKISTYKTNFGITFGFAIDDYLVSIADAFEMAGIVPKPHTLLELLEREDKDEVLKSAYKAALSKDINKILQSDVQWLPPIRSPKVLGCAINNSGIAKLASVCPERPNYFVKPTSSLIGHKQPIVIRPDYGLTHPEAELAVIIGKRVKNISVEEVREAIFGYTIINDITSITLKSEDTFVFPAPSTATPQPGFEHGDMQLVYHARSKGTDTFGPCGPWIVTKDEISDPNNLAVRVFMNDEECCTDNTANLRYRIEEVVSWASRYFTLEPGDMIHCGTAAAGRYGLRELDYQVWDGVCSIEIDGVGRLSNPIKRVDLKGNLVAAKPKKPGEVWPPRYLAEK